MGCCSKILHWHLQGSHSDWKTWKNGKTFSSQGILNGLEKSGKSHKILENSGNVRQMLFVVIFKWTVYYLLKWLKFSVKKNNKTLKKYWENGKKYWKNWGICQSWKVGTMTVCIPLCHRYLVTLKSRLFTRKMSLQPKLKYSWIQI